MKRITSAVVVAMAAAMPVEAALLTYRVDGVFADGSTLTGGFVFDDQGASIETQFTSITVTVIGRTGFTTEWRGSSDHRSGRQTNRAIGIGFYDAQNWSNYIDLAFLANYSSASVFVMPKIQTITSTTLGVGGSGARSGYRSASGYSALVRGTITRLDAAAVPEPATWAMMIAGFGLVGGIARRRTAAFGTGAGR